MFFLARPDTQSVHLLAEMLESIEVTADELMDNKLDGSDLSAIRALSDDGVEEQLARLRTFVGEIKELELGIVAKLGQARDKARAVARSDWRLRPIMMLFTSGTQAFVDRLDAEPDPAQREFEGAGQIFPYLRSRGLVSPMTVTYDGSAELLVTDSFRLFGVLPMRDLLERCEATLNALDAHYDLRDLEDDAAEEASVDVVAAPGGANVSQPAFATAVAEPTVEVTPIPPILAEAASAPTAVADKSALGEKPVEAQQVEAALAVAQQASEAGLKGLTERLAEMKSDVADEAPASDGKVSAA